MNVIRFEHEDSRSMIKCRNVPMVGEFITLIIDDQHQRYQVERVEYCFSRNPSDIHFFSEVSDDAVIYGKRIQL